MNRTQVKKILGKGKYVTDMQEVQDRTGDDQEGRSAYMGILLYKGSYWINVCKDGTFHVHIERSEYADPDLFKLETVLAEWVKGEEEGAKRYEAEAKKKDENKPIDWHKKAADKLVGRTIKSVSYMTEEEAEKCGWNSRPLMIELDNGVWIFPSSDDEGNDGGSIHASDSEYEFPVL